MPFAWVAADTVYGVGAVEMALRRAGKGYVLGVSSEHQFHSWGRTPFVGGTAENVARGLTASAWRRLSAGNGTKGPRLYDWAYLELADLDAADFGGTNDGGSGRWTRGLLIRRGVGDGEMACFSTWCPAGTAIETLVAVEGRRWAIEEGFEVAKTELGLDHNETRSWHGWHRHVSLVMLALAMLTTIRHRANSGRKKKSAAKVTQANPRAWFAGRCRKCAASPYGWRSDALSRHWSLPGRCGGGPIRRPHSTRI